MIKPLIIIMFACSGCFSSIHSVDRLQEANVRRFNLQGLQALRAKEILEAQANFKLAYQIFPNPESLDGLGVCQFYLKNYSRAQQFYIRAYQHDNKYYNALINLAFLYETTGFQSLAHELYAQLIKKYPENYKLQNNFSAFLFDHYRQYYKLDVEFRLLQAKSILPDPLILRNLKKVKNYGD